MTPQTQRLIHLLADGELHSGEKLSAILGVSRAAVWKQLKKLEAYGLEVIAERSRGYRLAEALSLLSLEALKEALPSDILDNYSSIVVANTTGSTNADALDLLAVQGGPSIVTAEYQDAGRGRRGKHWVSPYGANIYLSIAWPFYGGVADIAGLSLAVGVVTARVLRSLGLTAAQLKWPNDVYIDGQKVGGVLIEMQGEPNDQLSVVVGIGLNVRMPRMSSAQIDQAWTDLSSHGVNASRATLLQSLICALDEMWRNYSQQGFQAYEADWQALDFLRGKKVRVQLGDTYLEGIAAGVADDGAFLMRDAKGEVQRYYGGEVSLRPL